MMLSTTRAGVETDDAFVPRTVETIITVRSEALSAHAAELDRSRPLRLLEFGGFHHQGNLAKAAET